VPSSRVEDAEKQSASRTVILSSGERVLYPEPSSAAATRIGVANRRSNTSIERRLRSALHSLGLRFRKDLLVRAGGLRVHPDVVFTRARVALFVDGCFWHACPDHGTVPRHNIHYWQPKLRANVERDARVKAALRGEGWYVRRVWEHEDAQAVATELAPVIRGRSATRRSA
jgi:DNA mismatch endonuclease (patch repair protein)